jgi:hypothetical protein
MKSLLLLTGLFVLELTVTANAQSAKESRAAIEVAASKKGVLLKKDYTVLGDVQNVEFRHLRVEDMSSKIKYSGVEVTFDDNEGFIDSDELRTLVKALEMVRDNRLDPKPGVVYEFMSRGGFNMQFFWNKEKWFMRMGVGPKYLEKSSYTVELADVLKLIRYMNDAVAIL